ncbi:MAG: hypothetical protein CMG55_06075 [Candidatus Marinimicrobia bacterium]|nr:hypothetical protein [Candidatus Neomarinimicrobiota bacterium]|tara:strand:+ start:1785 stop:2837 length:1053 start_codon:yes stop_codon:yes gene_type:complete
MAIKKNKKNSNVIFITEVFEIIAQDIKLIIIVPIIIIIFSIINIQFYTKPIYVSTSKIVSSGASNSGVSQAVGLAAQFGISLGGSQSGPKWIYSEMVNSRDIAKKMLARTINIEKNQKPRSLYEIILKENINNTDKEKLDFMAYEALMDMIEISEDQRTGIITLNVKSYDKHLAYQLNKIIIEELDNHQREYNSSLTARGRNFIEERIIQTEKELNLAEEDLKKFRESNRRIENSPGLLLDQQRLDREVLVLTGVFTTLKQQLETTKIEQVKESDYVIIINPPNIPLYYTSPRKRQYVVLAGLYGIGFALFLSFLKHYLFVIFTHNKDDIFRIIDLFYKNLVPKSYFRKK